jgi:hypothetical protein
MFHAYSPNSVLVKEEPHRFLGAFRCDNGAMKWDKKGLPDTWEPLLRGEDENRKSSPVPSRRLWKAFIINAIF